jgi:hypothetical protein
MEKPTQIDIVRRAYELWQESGQPEGRDQEFYLQAEKELSIRVSNALISRKTDSAKVKLQPSIWRRETTCNF